MGWLDDILKGKTPFALVPEADKPFVERSGAAQKKGFFGIGGAVSLPGAAYSSIRSIAIPAGIGAGAGFLAGTVLTKKEAPQTQSFAPQTPVQQTYTTTYAPVTTTTTQRTDAPTTMIQWESPGASMTKKDVITGTANPWVTSEPYVGVSPSQVAAQRGEQGQGTDWATLAAIAGVALVAYGYVARKK